MDSTAQKPKSSLAATYEVMAEDRAPYLRRARDAAKLTLPHLLTEQGHQNGDLPTPYQSIGAKGVTSLSSKLLLTLFPPSQSFFRHQTSEFVLAAFGDKQRQRIEATLAQIERDAMSFVESAGWRPYLNETLKQLLVSGNSLLHLDEANGAKLKAHKLDSYVCKRDPSDNLVRIIIKESISVALLPEAVQAQLRSDDPDLKEDIDLYTGVFLQDDGKMFKVWQEAGHVIVPDTVGTYKRDELPYMALRMEPITGQSYGYGYVNGLYGDLKSVEALRQALVEAAAASSRILFLVKANSVTDPKDLEEAPNGAVRSGNPDDVGTLTVDKAADLNVAFQAQSELINSLSASFLLHTSIQRKGERVTAEEIRFMAQELEDVLAGTYSLLSVELQLPLVRLLLKYLTKKKLIPPVPVESQPTVVTGLEALGRGHDLMRLDQYLGGAVQILGEHALSVIDVRGYMEERATALRILPETVLKSEEQLQAEQQQAQMQQLVERLGPNVVNQVGQQMAAPE